MYDVAMRNRTHDSIIDLTVQCTCVDSALSMCADFCRPEIGTTRGIAEHNARRKTTHASSECQSFWALPHAPSLKAYTREVQADIMGRTYRASGHNGPDSIGPWT